MTLVSERESGCELSLTSQQQAAPSYCLGPPNHYWHSLGRAWLSSSTRKLPFLTHLHLQQTHCLTTLKITLKIKEYLKNIWRGICKPNWDTNFQSNISLNVALLSRCFRLCKSMCMHQMCMGWFSWLFHGRPHWNHLVALCSRCHCYVCLQHCANLVILFIVTENLCWLD